VQHRPLLSLDPILPKLSKISPLEAASGVLAESLVNFAKAW